MAQYIAELITQAESASGDEREKLRTEAAATIIRLWEHRTNLPGRVPLESVDRLIDTLDALDPSTSAWRYFKFFDPDTAAPADTDIADVFALSAAVAIERSARILLRSLIRVAARVALNRDAQWIEAAKPLESPSFGRLRERLESLTGGESETVSGDPGLEELSESIAVMAAAVDLARDLLDTLRAPDS